jgi:hypothetical protein
MTTPKQSTPRKAGKRPPANLSSVIRGIPAQTTLSPEQLTALFLRHLMDADAVIPTRPEAMYDNKTKALTALANLARKDEGDPTGTLDALLATGTTAAPPPKGEGK